jgi:hypothetical protein
VQLLRRPVRLDTPAALLPETLSLDGRRLAGVRDELDRLALVAVYSALMRQHLASLDATRRYRFLSMIAYKAARVVLRVKGEGRRVKEAHLGSSKEEE